MFTVSEKLQLLSNNLGKLKPMKVAAELRKIAAEVEEEEDTPEFKEYKTMLNKIKNNDSFKKLKIFLDNPRLKKPIRWWLTSIDKGEGTPPQSSLPPLSAGSNCLLGLGLPGPQQSHSRGSQQDSERWLS